MEALLGGDFRFFWPENMHFFSGIPQAWDTSLNTGVGQPQLNTLWITSYLNFTASFAQLGLSWNSIAFFFWLVPSILIAFFSVYVLFRQLFHGNRLYAFLAGFIYIINTYFLLLFFGGQIGIVFAYSLFPLVIKSFLTVFEKPTLKSGLIAGLSLASIVLFDPRITYVSLFVVFSSFFFLKFFKIEFKKQLLFSFFVPFTVTGLLHCFWLIPLFLYKAPLVPGAVSLDSTSSFVFFSFATFENALGLLHPNWPENIFGKVGFMKAEFLILPLLAYSSLLFIGGKAQKKAERHAELLRRTILFFALLGLLGVFLAKGANEPFGAINLFLFDHLPGMKMFRDPTKFYMLIALAYSVLIPFTISSVFKLLNSKVKTQKSKIQFKIQKYIKYIFVLLLTSYLLFLISPLFSQQWIKPKQVPQEYVQLKDFLYNSKSFSRTLWIPQWQRYGYFSDLHPAIGRGEVVGTGTPVTLAKKLSDPKIIETLRVLGVRYIILPFDSEGELFTNDHTYDDKQYQKVKQILDRTKQIKKVKQFGKIVVYEISHSFDLFSIENKKSKVEWKELSSSKYTIELKRQSSPQVLIFSMAYDPYWSARFDGKTVSSQRYAKNVNRFFIPPNVTHVEIFYQPQKWVEVGLGVSLGSLIVIAYLVIKLSGYKVIKK